MPLSLPRNSPVLPNSFAQLVLSQTSRKSHTVTARAIHIRPSLAPSRAPNSYPFLLQSRPLSITTFKMAPTTSIDTAALKAHTPIVISGPSGAGKSTILKRLFEEYPDKFGFSVSHTTRSPRAGEQDGREYNFVTKEEFLDLVEKKGFVEHAQFGGNHYGTSIKAVEDIAEKGRICILDIEMEVRYSPALAYHLPSAFFSDFIQGVKQVANHPTFPRPRFLFLSPPSPEVLEQRLRSRATDSEEAILKRLKQANVELEFASSKEAPHDKIVVNDDLEKAYQDVKEFIIGGEVRAE